MREQLQRFRARPLTVRHDHGGAAEQRARNEPLAKPASVCAQLQQLRPVQNDAVGNSLQHAEAPRDVRRGLEVPAPGKRHLMLAREPRRPARPCNDPRKVPEPRAGNVEPVHAHTLLRVALLLSRLAAERHEHRAVAVVARELGHPARDAVVQRREVRRQEQMRSHSAPTGALAICCSMSSYRSIMRDSGNSATSRAWPRLGERATLLRPRMQLRDPVSEGLGASILHENRCRSIRCPSISTFPPARVAMTGVRSPIASASTLPKISTADGWSSTLAAAMAVRAASGLCAPARWLARRRCAQPSSSAERHGPSPQNTNLAWTP